MKSENQVLAEVIEAMKTMNQAKQEAVNLMLQLLSQKDLTAINNPLKPKVKSFKLNGRVENEYGTFYWQDNLLHRTDGPAMEFKDGTKLYFFKGGQRKTAEGCGRSLRKPV